MSNSSNSTVTSPAVTTTASSSPASPASSVPGSNIHANALPAASPAAVIIPRHASPAAATTSTAASAMRDRSDLLFYAALALLPVDGTILGVQMPYYSPLSPLLFTAYVICNTRFVPAALRRFPALPPLFALLAATSVYGWVSVGVNVTYLIRTTLALLFGALTLLSFTIAWSAKRLSMRTTVTVVVCAYGAAFLFGVLTWLAQPNHLNIPLWRNQLMQLFLRQYFIARPQFLFAEPSYIGMHLFGLLLPLFWISRDRRLIALVVVFAAGSLAMGAGVRIVLDTVVAGALFAVAEIPWGRLWARMLRDRRLLAGSVLGLAALVSAGVGLIATQPRIQTLLARGLFTGDASMSARILRTIQPLAAGLHDWPHLLFGFGAGNLAEAMQRGFPYAFDWYRSHGGLLTEEISEMEYPLGPTLNRAGNVFTMDAYASFIVEFGVLMFAAALALLLWHVTRWHTWSRTTVCWLLLLAYLYAQFEAYAFPAIWLFIWACASGAHFGRTSGARRAHVGRDAQARRTAESVDGLR